MTLKERVVQYCKAKEISLSQFERLSGLSNGYFKNKTQLPRSQKRAQILKAFPDINHVWLLTGEGPMLNTDINKSIGMENNVKTAPPDYNKNSTMEMIKILREQNEFLQRELERLHALINRMQTPDNQKQGGGEFEPLKKETAG